MKEIISSLADKLFASVTGNCEEGRPALPYFTYKGIPFSPAVWGRDVSQLESCDKYDKYQIVYKSPDNLLRLRILYTIYNEYPVIEWLPFVESAGDVDSGIVDGFRSLYLEIPLKSPGERKNYPRQMIRLRRNLGAMTHVDDFCAQDVWLSDRYPLTKARMDTNEGRSSAAWLPFFGIDFDDEFGFNVGIGWSGQWDANFEIAYDRDLDAQKKYPLKLKVDSGMERTHFRVHPGESIRQPSMFVMLRDGMSVTECMNLHRRFMLDFHSPHGSDGKAIRPPFAVAVWGGQTNDTVMSYLDEIERRHLRYDLLWMDAGWYGEDREVATDEHQGSDWARTVGNWRVNQIPHPGGLSPIATKAHSMGMKFMLWVEMERVIPGSPLAKEHPAWVLKNPAVPEDSFMLNLGNPDARRWAVDTVRRLVECEGVDYYREDFNFNTIPYWRGNDTDERQGICEAKFVAGLYEFWDELLRLFPNMMIDNCASGGRRIDFETASRSVCMYRSDIIGRYFYDSSSSQLSQLHYLAQWVPLFGGRVAVEDGHSYEALACVSPGISFGCGYDPSQQDAAWEKSITDCMKRMADCMMDDFYPLTLLPESFDKWVAYQFHNPEKDSGFFAAFRLPDASEKSIALQLQGVSPRATYTLEDGLTGEVKEVKGSELQSFTVSGKPKSAKVFFYARGKRDNKRHI